MPRARANIGRHTRRARFAQTRREQRTEDQRLQDNENSRAHRAQFFQNETPQHRSERLHAAASRQRELRQRATDANIESERQRDRRNRQLMRSTLNRLEFEYDPEIDYSSHTKVVIGDMDRMCQYCNALTFHNETNGMCCASGKVVLPALNPPPEPLKSLISGVSTQSKSFLSKIRKFNSCFQMTSFGATVRGNTGFESTFKIQGQVYHRVGSMLPSPMLTQNSCRFFLWAKKKNKCVLDAITITLQRRMTEKNHKNHKWLGERAILAARNVDVDEMNYRIQDKLPGESITFRSIDTMVEENECVNYPTEFLNSLDIPGLPPHKLQLQIGSTIILLRNLNAPRLCNGTRLAIKKIMGNVIAGTIISGRYKGEEVLIPRIPMIPTDLPFKFKRLQFPIRLAFAMTINKAQGQTMSVCGINLENPCFSHGQLYVACSRVGNPSNLYIHAPDGKTRNIVHELVLR